VAVRQPGKTTRRVCGDYRAINDICLLHQAPVKDARFFLGGSSFNDETTQTALDPRKGGRLAPITIVI
jgi:hypothetical protein